ncbi:MAG: Tex family protein [Flavicella sp.]
MQAVDFIKTKTDLRDISILNTLQLLNEDCTVPFISRYRKEKTGNLNEVQVAAIQNFKREFEELEKRKKSILKNIDDLGKLEDSLKMKIVNADNLISLEDLYLPFKKKRKTKADTARENGLEGLAKMIFSQNVRDLAATSQRFVKGPIEDSESALEGARFIIAEWINERIDLRNTIRGIYQREATVSAKEIKSRKEASEVDLEKAQKYRDYFDWSESLRKCPSHRLLALLRAENEGVLRLKISVNHERVLNLIENRIIRSQNDCKEQLEIAITDSYKRLIAPSISNEVLAKAKEDADTNAIEVFAKNLRQLLLQAPLGEKAILALDPGFRTGCKLVCLDKNGKLKHNETLFLHKEREAIGKLSTLVQAYDIEAIAIGDGTASRETEALVKKVQFNKKVPVFVVNEAGASIYSASKIARDEFPNYDVTVRGSVSIGRRLSDPLAELVKIEAKSIGVGQYQHDVDQNKLQQRLDSVVESCVNSVGVNLNTASASLLQYVSGIGPKLAENIVNYRNENGSFQKRIELKKVARLGGKSYEQSVAFLRIPNAINPLDNSAVHPESYDTVKKMAKDSGKNTEDLIGNDTILDALDLEKYTDDSVGLPTLKDIVKELKKPGLDPRKKRKQFAFAAHVKNITDLNVGDVLPGIVNNVTNFGCFVNIGIKESGLVHISKLSKGFVNNVSEHVSLQQEVRVRVEEVDLQRKRIQLSMNFE